MPVKKKKTTATPKKKSKGEGKQGYVNGVPPKPPVHGQWGKGESGNPEGGRAHDPDIRKLKSLTKKELAEVGNLIVNGNFQELIRIKDEIKLQTSKDSALKVMMASVAMRIISKGDMHALDILLNRLIGKVKDEVDLNGNLNNNVKVIVSLPSNGREAPKAAV